MRRRSRTDRREEFISRISPFLANLVLLARRLAGSDGQPEDVLQAALAASWERYAKGESVEDIRAWILRFLVHECHNERRRRSKVRERETPLDEIDLAGSFEDVVAALERELEYEGCRSNEPGALLDCLDERLSSALMSLAVEERSALLLRAIADLDYREIAEVCAVPVGTVMSRIYRARQKIRARLTEARVDPPTKNREERLGGTAS